MKSKLPSTSRHCYKIEASTKCEKTEQKTQWSQSFPQQAACCKLKLQQNVMKRAKTQWSQAAWTSTYATISKLQNVRKRTKTQWSQAFPNQQAKQICSKSKQTCYNPSSSKIWEKRAKPNEVKLLPTNKRQICTKSKTPKMWERN